MKGQTNRSIIDHSLQTQLRIHMTDAENRLWRHLRARQLAGFKFRRQHPFTDYILDFVCLEKHLVVEIDGSQHQDCEHDRIRDHRLSEAGFHVMRFWNNQVLQETESVVEAIWTALHEDSQEAGPPISPSPPCPSP